MGLAAPAHSGEPDGQSPENGENDLVGPRTVLARHFTACGQAHTAVSVMQADARAVKPLNLVNDIGTAGTQAAAYWRIRQGAADRDSPLAVPLVPATKLADSGKRVGFLPPFSVPHSGDYDLTQLFDWVDGVVQ